MFIKNVGELAKSSLHSFAVELIEFALNVADPYKAVINNVKVEKDRVVVRGEVVDIGRRVHVVGFGKASKRMAEALIDLMGDRILGGIVITPSEEGRIGPVQVVKGDHPIPRENTLRSSQKLLSYITESVSEEDTLVVLVSGGGSALFEVPENGVTLEDIAYLSKELMKRGADIVELNTIRKRLSKVKGGKMLRFVKAKNVLSLIISDVVGDRLDTIASGPTAPDDTTFRDAYNILNKYKLLEELPENVRNVFTKGLAGDLPDTLKPGDKLFNKVKNIIIASNSIVLEEVAKKVEGLGFKPLILTSMLEGEAREVGKVLASIVKSIHQYGKPIPRPAALIAGGETTVTVKGSGVGGRNQEMCLSLAMRIKGLPNVVAACFATDGVDGVSPATGAIVDGETIDRALDLGLDPQKHLDNNDSYTLLSKLGCSIVTGYTGTNVNDVFIALIK